MVELPRSPTKGYKLLLNCWNRVRRENRVLTPLCCLLPALLPKTPCITEQSGNAAIAPNAIKGTTRGARVDPSQSHRLIIRETIQRPNSHVSLLLHGRRLALTIAVVLIKM